MAKALLLLSARDGQRDALQAGLARCLRETFDGVDHLTAQLMVQREADIFFDPNGPHPRPELVLELVTAPGKPLGSMQAGLADLLADLPVDTGSLAFLVQERKYIPSGPQPIYYHMLMVKRAEFALADYNDYYSNFHCRMGFKTPGIEGYSQNYVDHSASETLAQTLGLSCREVASISELKFATTEGFFEQPGIMEVAEAAAQDEGHFLDRSQSLSFSSEVVLRLGDFEAIGDAVFEQRYPV